MTPPALAAVALAGCVSLPDHPPPCVAQRLDELYVDGTHADYEPWLSPDHLELVFRRDVMGPIVMTTQRASVEQAFAAPTAINGVTAPLDPFVTDDDLELWTVDGMQRLWTATRRARDQPFGNAQQVAGFTSLQGASLTADGLTIVFAQGQRLYKTTRATTSAAFDATMQQEIAFGIASTGLEVHPSISSDGTTLVFQRNDSNGASVGLFEASGPDLAIVKSLEGDLGGVGHDDGPQLGRDGRTIAFSSSRATLGGGQLFVYCE